MNRQRLPDRRPHELIDFKFGNTKYTAGVGRFDDGSLGEIFLNTAKSGTDLETIAKDAAVTVSIALQFGTPLDTLRKALARTGNGGPGSALAFILDMVAAETAVSS